MWGLGYSTIHLRQGRSDGQLGCPNPRLQWTMMFPWPQCIPHRWGNIPLSPVLEWQLRHIPFHFKVSWSSNRSYFGAMFPQLDLWHKPHRWRNSFYVPAKIAPFSSSPRGAILWVFWFLSCAIYFLHPSLRLGHDPELVPFMWSLGAPNVSLHRLLLSGSPRSKAGQPGRLVYPENSMGHSTDSCCLIIYSTSIIMVSIYGILHVDVFWCILFFWLIMILSLYYKHIMIYLFSPHCGKTPNQYLLRRQSISSRFVLGFTRAPGFWQSILWHVQSFIQVAIDTIIIIITSIIIIIIISIIIIIITMHLQ